LARRLLKCLRMNPRFVRTKYLACLLTVMILVQPAVCLSGEAPEGARPAGSGLVPIIEAEGLIARAKECFFDFRYADARRALGGAIAILGDGSREVESAPLLLDAHLTDAMISNSLKREDEARQSLISAMEIDPLLELSEAEYPPSMVSLSRAVRSSVRERPAGSLKVSSRTKEAQVYVNGIGRGAAPLEIAGLPEGPYAVSLAAEGHRTETRQVQVAANETSSVDVRLKRQRAGRKNAEGDEGSDSRKRPIYKQPLFWGAVGALAVGGIIGGVLAASSGGPSRGDIKVTFK